jgi:hypothetical protein
MRFQSILLESGPEVLAPAPVRKQEKNRAVIDRLGLRQIEHLALGSAEERRRCKVDDQHC